MYALVQFALVVLFAHVFYSLVKEMNSKRTSNETDLSNSKSTSTKSMFCFSGSSKCITLDPVWDYCWVRCHNVWELYPGCVLEVEKKGIEFLTFFSINCKSTTLLKLGSLGAV